MRMKPRHFKVYNDYQDRGALYGTRSLVHYNKLINAEAIAAENAYLYSTDTDLSMKQVSK